MNCPVVPDRFVWSLGLGGDIVGLLNYNRLRRLNVFSPFLFVALPFT